MMLLGSSLSLCSSATMTAPQLSRIQCRRGDNGIEEKKLQTDMVFTNQAAILATHDMISTTYPVLLMLQAAQIVVQVLIYMC
jgi:hypothetical protein